MKDDLLKPAPLEVWSSRFLQGASNADVAFVTPGGHVLSWRQFRFAYPRYHVVAEEWRPPNEGLDAMVLHFGAYEVSLPAAELSRTLGIFSTFRTEHQKLKTWWQTKHPDTASALSMEGEILIERWAAVSSKLEVFMAVLAFDGEPLQHLLQDPGVRLDRSPARLSEVALELADEVPPVAVLREAVEGIRQKFDAWRRARHDPTARRTAVEEEGRTHATRERARQRQQDLLRLANRYFDVRGMVRMTDLAAAIPEEYWTEEMVYPTALFVEAIRQRMPTRDLLRLARALGDVNSERCRVRASDGDYAFWADIAVFLRQNRTAWCLAVRAMDGGWRHGTRRLDTVGGGEFEESARAVNINTLANLATLARHEYWAPAFALWSADYDDAVRALEEVSRPKPLAQGSAKAAATKDVALLGRARSARAPFRERIKRIDPEET